MNLLVPIYLHTYQILERLKASRGRHFHPALFAKQGKQTKNYEKKLDNEKTSNAMHKNMPNASKPT